MGILSDFFVAAPEQITEDRFRRGPAGTFPTVQSNRLTPVEMDELLRAVRRDHGDDTEPSRGAFPLALTCPSEEAWVIACPAELRDALAEAAEEDLRRYAARWAASEQLQFIRADEAQLRSLLRDLAELAGLAVARNESLYLWLSV
jgi:hypothetical protein